ncbi:MAG: D-alanyl-D-alanine carboxypeptidase [Acetatifactor sp.]|nr:D-alanyl-D-alanine carboxypeptidase [Acetatifactor sp.]
MLKTKTLFHRYISGFTALVCAGALFFHSGPAVFAASKTELALENNRAMPIQSNEVANWPAGPVVGAESAILIELETGAILYEKNIHMKEYPASTTKILTTLIASELCSMDEIVTFSHDAVFDTPRDSSHIAMDVGQELTMEQCLNAILIRSANEVSFAVAEHITDTTDWSVFAEMMNERATELGCLNSHFVNPNGLPDEDHYTTAYDLAMIGRAFFSNEMLCKITLTRRMEFPVTDKLPKGKLEVNLMQIIPGGKYAYEYLVGCKTGYTDTARSCLVSCAEKDGMKLICVVMKDESPYQYEDTIALFNYGFNNFDKVNVSQTETKYNIDNTGLFYSGNDIFGNSQPILSLNKNDYVILPKTTSFDELDSVISYDTQSESQAAIITYTYHDVYIGSVSLNFAEDQEDASYLFQTPEEESPKQHDSSFIFINIVKVLGILIAIGVIGIIFILMKLLLKNFSFAGRGRRAWKKQNRRRRRKAKRANRFRDFDF